MHPGVRHLPPFSPADICNIRLGTVPTVPSLFLWHWPNYLKTSAEGVGTSGSNRSSTVILLRYRTPTHYMTSLLIASAHAVAS
jgi:hypothetical protein